MRILVDMDRCQGHARCAVAAPDLLDTDEGGYAVVIRDGDLHDGEEAQALAAAAQCPERAITVG